MIHMIRTVYCDSDISYRGDELEDWENCLQGTLKGIVSVPAVWDALCSLIFDILHKRGFTSKIMSSICKQLFTLIGFVYTYNCNLFRVVTDLVEDLTSIQSLINSWEYLMEVTGSTIRTDKSWWCLIKYEWKRGKWIVSNPDVGIDLVATGVDGNVVSLKIQE